jgi:hypothetical protein
MSNEKQTAVEWLGNEITNRITRRNPHDTIIIQILGETLIELIEQAKEMEKAKIVKAFDDGDYNYHYSRKTGNDFENGEEYFEETYGGNK